MMDRLIALREREKERTEEVVCRRWLSAEKSYAMSSENNDTFDGEFHHLTCGSLVDDDVCSIERVSLWPVVDSSTIFFLSMNSLPPSLFDTID